MATDGAEGLPVVRIGRLLRVPRARLEAWVGGPLTATRTNGESPQRQSTGALDNTDLAALAPHPLRHPTPTLPRHNPSFLSRSHDQLSPSS